MGLNILNIGPTPPRLGGSAFSNIEGLIGLSERGHHVDCISQLTQEHIKLPDFDASWKDSGVNVYPFILDWIPSSVPPTPEYMAQKKKLILERFYSLIDKNPPDVLMVGHESFSFYANKEARRLGIPVVQVHRGTPTHGINDGIYPPDLTDKFLEAVNEATLVVGVSKYLANILNENGITQTTYIYNSVDVDTFRPKTKDEVFLRRLGIDISDKVILHASNIKPVKRPLDIVKAAKKTLSDKNNLVYVIVGEGPLLSEMHSLVRDLGLESNFRFVNRIPYSEMPTYFQNADIFLLPSENEGFSRAIREAQACSTVPIASNIGPLPEAITNAYDGLLFQKGDTDDLARKILSYVNDDYFRISNKNHARLTAIKNDRNKMLSEYESALTDPKAFLAARPTIR